MSWLVYHVNSFTSQVTVEYCRDGEPSLMIDRDWLLATIDREVESHPPVLPKLDPRQIGEALPDPLPEYPDIGSIDQAVTWVLSNEVAAAELDETKWEDVILLHHSMGQWIRNTLGLWRPGLPLVGDSHPDDVSQTIIERAWKRLHGDRT